jgi:hypothetical protein
MVGVFQGGTAGRESRKNAFKSDKYILFTLAEHTYRYTIKKY